MHYHRKSKTQNSYYMFDKDRFAFWKKHTDYTESSLLYVIELLKLNKIEKN